MWTRINFYCYWYGEIVDISEQGVEIKEPEDWSECWLHELNSCRGRDECTSRCFRYTYYNCYFITNKMS